MRYDLVPAHFAHSMMGNAPEGWMSGEDWVLDLPDLLEDLLREWELEPIGPTMTGACSVALPVRLTGSSKDLAGVSGEAVLKVSWPHHEAAPEALALQAWNGRGAVRLLRADPTRFALLLERLHPRDLHQLPDDEACEVIGGLLRTLRTAPHPRVPSLDEWALRQADALESQEPVIPRRYLEQAVHLARELVTRPVEPALLHTDLHYANVLASYRSPWLAIDPKPMAGDPAFEVAPALWNRSQELGTGAQIRWSLRQRLEIITQAGGIEEGRARAWTIVREAVNAMWLGPDPRHRERVNLAVMIIKAMND